jgi:hypothetical protein
MKSNNDNLVPVPLSPAAVVAAMMLLSLAHVLGATKLDGVMKNNTINFNRM